MKRRYPHKKNVLLVNITRLGDMLQATPTIAGMKEENPDCKITVLVEKQFESICKIIPHIDEVLSIDLGMTVRSLCQGADGIIDGFEYISELVEDLRSRNFDYCLNMSSSAYTALLLQLVGVKRRGGWVADEEGNRIIESEWARLFASSVFHTNRHYTGLNLVDIFRCSADVEKHPQKLLLKVDQESKDYCQEMLKQAGLLGPGPLICVQAGASQAKRQWSPQRFVDFIKILVDKHQARVVLTGSKKELSIVEPIAAGVNSPNVLMAAGETSIPQLAALLQMADLLVTGDTGPMHISVAVGTPVLAMFLASAFGFETGPYSEGNLVLQPVIGCGPCNPNKDCARPDCHLNISPQLLAELAWMRSQQDVTTLASGMIDSNQLIVYRTCFDQHGFYDMQALNKPTNPVIVKLRNAYRSMWLDDLGGLEITAPAKSSALGIQDEVLSNLEQVASLAEKGQELIGELAQFIRDESSDPAELSRVNKQLHGLDVIIEKTGFQYPELGPVTRMFLFSKENISGSTPLELASQMEGVYQDLTRRSHKLARYYSDQTH